MTTSHSSTAVCSIYLGSFTVAVKALTRCAQCLVLEEACAAVHGCTRCCAGVSATSPNHSSECKCLHCCMLPLLPLPPPWLLIRHADCGVGRPQQQSCSKCCCTWRRKSKVRSSSSSSLIIPQLPVMHWSATCCRHCLRCFFVSRPTNAATQHHSSMFLPPRQHTHARTLCHFL
jgi:hypothetical protein